MLASISDTLTKSGLNIENLTTDLQQAKDGTVEFVVTADCVSTRYMSSEQMRDLASSLGAIKDSLQLSVVDVRVLRLTTETDCD